MKVYKDSKGTYIRICSKKLESNGFTEGTEFSMEVNYGRIILVLKGGGD